MLDHLTHSAAHDPAHAAAAAEVLGALLGLSVVRHVPLMHAAEAAEALCAAACAPEPATCASSSTMQNSTLRCVTVLLSQPLRSGHVLWCHSKCMAVK